MEEIWKPVERKPDMSPLLRYEVSNLGRIRSIRIKSGKTRMLKPQKCGTYLIMHFSEHGKHYYMHVLVWEAFNGHIPDELEVNHINEDGYSNELSNLELLSHKDNCNYGTRNERMRDKKSIPICMCNKNGELIKEFNSIKEAADYIGKDTGNICQCCKGKLKTAYGFVWKYK